MRPQEPHTQLPEGYSLRRVLSRGSQGVVMHCERLGQPVVVRCVESRAGSAREAFAELRVLSALDHPQLARLVDHGLAPTPGEIFLVRNWIEGQTLDRHLAALPPRGSAREIEVARVFAAIGEALEALHAAGFVHADLKAANVIVRPDGTPVLTDFGLAAAHGHARERSEVAGSLATLAPEQLAGGALDARTDLFALGAMLYDALALRKRDLPRFYSRFPAEDFLRAAEADPAALPEWARTLVGELVLRDPAQRPASASLVAARLRARAGSARTLATEERWLWPMRRGREAWFDGLLQRLLASNAPSGVLQLVLVNDAEAAVLVEELRLSSSVRGARALALEPTVELRGSASARDLDQWSEKALERGEGALLVAALPAEDPLARRALEYLARTLLAAGEAHGTRLALVGRPLDISGPGWAAPEVVPALGFDLLRGALEAGLDRSARSRLDEFARAVWDQTRGEAPAVQLWLDAARAAGVLVRGEGGWRVTGSLAAVDTQRGPATRLLGDARTLALALEVCGRGTSAEELYAVSGLEPSEFEAAAAEMRAGGLLENDSASGWTLRGTAPADVPPGLRRKLHAARARWLEGSGGAEHLVRLHQLLAAPDAAGLARFFAALAALRDRGLPARALEACARARREYELEGQSPPPELLADEAQAWAVLGELARARELVARMPVEASRSGMAARERALGTICTRSYEHARALEHFTRAAELDPEQAGEAQLGRALVLFETRREDELARLLDSLEHPGAPRLSSRTAINLDMIRALSWIRGGQHAQAEELLERRRDAAVVAEDALAEAAAELNLGTLRTRQGRQVEAQRCFERAAARSESAGALVGVAQARALLGTSLRESGELGRAQPLLESALLIRERLGDEGGARIVRWMLGMLLADRGRVLPALQELSRSVEALERAGRPSDAVLPRARAEEVEARLRPSPPRGSASSGGENDPRVLLVRARTDAYAERANAARSMAQRALELAEHLGHGGSAQEARDLLALLRLDSQVSQPEERALLDLLGRDSWTETDRRALRSTAEVLERAGRDDRAARAWLGLAARLEDPPEAEAALARAERLLEACTAGLSPVERARFERTLLGRPDPWPRDISRARNRAEDEELDMDMLKILEINHRLVLQEELPALLGTIVESALSVSGGERGFLVLAEKGELRIDTAFDSRRGGMEEPELELSRSIVRRALDERAPLRISNASDDPDLGAAPSVAALELRSILCVPFVIDEELSGVIYVDHRVRAGAFAERAERLLSLLADQAALAIRQVRRTDRIRELNRELEREVARKESDLRTARAVLRDAQLALPPSGLVGSSPAMRAVHQLIERAAPARLPVLVSGESGTGKELAARALHALSPRHEKPFVSENCAAFPASLIEAELFGSRKGAFTGSEEDRPGLFERADGGTLFLDEIGELPLELQAKLLRVLETSEVRRLGDSRVRKVDIRLVAATNRDLEAEVRGGRFRADLYYRLDGLRIALPTLASRMADIPELVDHFLRLEGARGSGTRGIAPSVLAALCRRAWPGNVRELANEIARLCVLSEGDLADASLVREPGATRVETDGPIETLDKVERRAIERAIEVCGGDKTRAAEMLGISRAKVYQRWKEWYGAGAD